MPHQFPLVRLEARTALLDLFGDWDSVERTLGELVADTFLAYTGERMRVGEQVLVHATVDTTSMPVSFVIIIVAKWTPERAPHFVAIQHDIESIVRAWNPSLTMAEVHLNVIGDPNRQGAEPFDPSEGLLGI